MTDDELEQLRSDLLAAFRWVDGHPDLWAIFREPSLLDRLGAALAAPFADESISVVVGVESRGFILGPLAARELRAGFAAVRKDGGLLPGDKVVRVSETDYRGNRSRLRLQRGALGPEDRAIIVDDWAETASQAGAVARMVRECGAHLVGTSLIVNQLSEGVASMLGRIAQIVSADELPEHDPQDAAPQLTSDPPSSAREA